MTNVEGKGRWIKNEFQTHNGVNIQDKKLFEELAIQQPGT